MKNFKHLKLYEAFSGDIGINDDKKELTVDFLNRLLSNEFILFMKIWNFHWIVMSPAFNASHTFLGKLYNSFFETIDETAERIRSLGSRPTGTLSGFLENTELKEYSDEEELPKESKIYEDLLEDYEFIIREIRNFLDTEGIDKGTTNYLEDLLMNLEKDAWMVRSHIL